MRRRQVLRGIASSSAIAFGASAAATASETEVEKAGDLSVEELDDDSYISTWEDGERIDHRVGDIDGDIEDVVGDPNADCCMSYCRSDCPKLCLCCNWVVDC
jgi:hypothetical protein